VLPKPDNLKSYRHWIGAFDQGLGASKIVGLPWREHQFDRIAQGIDERVDFGR